MDYSRELEQLCSSPGQCGHIAHWLLDRHGGKLQSHEVGFLIQISETPHTRLSSKQVTWLVNLVMEAPARKEQRAHLLHLKNRMERRLEMIEARLAEVKE